MAVARFILAYVAWVSYFLAQPGCPTQTINIGPIGTRNPGAIAGVMNGTFSLIFIPRGVADSLLPEGYAFLDDKYREAVKQWSEGMFPVLIKAVRIHVTETPNEELLIPDYSVGHKALLEVSG